MLEIHNVRLTGNLCGDIVSSERKASIVQELCIENNISMHQVISIGDGANDIPMLKQAGLSIAFNAKSITQKHAMFSINDSIVHIINLFGTS